jgi:hypothetical protein
MCHIITATWRIDWRRDRVKMKRWIEGLLKLKKYKR